MSVVRKIFHQPVPRLTPPWQRVQNACPEHPDCSMRKVQVLGRWLWECSHPTHIVAELAPVQNQATGGLLISPIRSLAARRTDAWRDVPPPVYALPEPAPTPIRQATGEIPPVASMPMMAGIGVSLRLARSAARMSESKPTRFTEEPVAHPALRDVTEADCQPDLSEGEDIDATSHSAAILRLRYCEHKKE